MQPELVELLRRKDVLLTPSPAVMTQIQDFLDYNVDHEQNPEHFLKVLVFLPMLNSQI